MCNLSLHFKSSGEWQIVFVGDNVELIKKNREIDHVTLFVFHSDAVSYSAGGSGGGRI